MTPGRVRFVGALLVLVAVGGCGSAEETTLGGDRAGSSSAPVTEADERPDRTEPSPAVSAAPVHTDAVSAGGEGTTTTAGPSQPEPPTSAVTCAAASDVLTTPSGRNVLLRSTSAAGAPLVLILHGYTGTPTGIERFADFTALANSAGVAVAYPEGTPTDQGGFGWSTGAAVFATTGSDDVGALAEMLDVIAATGCVDSSRVILAGESNGAGMALVAMCAPRLGGRFASVVMVIPAVDAGVLANCSPEGQGAPTPLTVVAGRIDQTVPYDGGRPPLLAQETWFETVATTVNGCRSVAPPQALSQVVDRLDGEGCAVCAELLAVADGTHTWPGTPEGTAGLVPGTFDLDRRLLALALGPVSGCLGDL